MDHIFNLHKVAPKLAKKTKKTNLYHHLTLTMKGVVGQLDNNTLKELKKVLIDENKQTVAFIDDLIKKGAPDKSNSKKAA